MRGIWNVLKYCTILPVVLYRCQAWSLILRKEHRLRLCESRVLRKIFGPKRDKVIGEWRRLHNKGLCDLYSSPHIIPVIKHEESGGQGMWLLWEPGEVHTGFWW
jgi:hypothetical protein